MSDDGKEILEIPGVTITLTDTSSFEDIIAQLQPYIDDRILCVVNGSELKILKDRTKLPLYLTFSGQAGQIFEFRDLSENSYAVFGREAASIVFPSLSDKVYRTASLTHGNITTTAVRIEESRAELYETVMDL